MIVLTRRTFTASALLASVTAGWPHTGFAATDISAQFAAIEKQTGGRLGVAGIDTATGHVFAHRAQERFAMCSTFKFLAVSAVLARVDRGKENLSRRVRFTTSDIIANSPITKDRVGGDGMSLAEICAAALDYSDNTAANFLISTLGGPAAVTQFARRLGDRVTRLDRTEPTLNEATPGDPRDTTMPAATVANLRALLLGKALSPSSRKQLTRWMIGNKTGSGDHGTANDIAIAWPPRRKPLVLAVYLTESTISPEAQNAAIAEVARAVVAAL
jgi:beta-lactamase class A